MNALLSRRFESVLGTSLLGVLLAGVLVPVIYAFDGTSGPLAQCIPLLFLVPVVLASALGGRVAGVVVGVAATFAWDWFFVPPQYEITVASPSHLVGLVVFFVVAALTGQLATLVRNAALSASQRARTAEALYGLSVGLISRRDVMTTLPPLAEGIRSTFDLEACAVLLPETSGWRTVSEAGNLSDRFKAERSRDVAACASWAAEHGSATGFDAPESSPQAAGPLSSQSRVRFLPLRVGNHSNGVLELIRRGGVTLDEQQERLLSTLTNGVALALEHNRLADEEHQALVARESDRLKSVLLSSVSHDLRTPLAGIKASVSSLLQRDVRWSQADQEGFLEDIDTEVDRLSRLVSNLLDLSRIEAGVLRPQKEWEDLGELARRTTARLRSRMKDHDLTLQTPPQETTVEVDPVHLEEVITNLVDNAAKYAPVHTPIEVSVELAGSSVRLCVTDGGTAIPLDQRRRVFDKFYRMAGTDKIAKGTGMGLAIVKGLVEANGGTVTIEDAQPGNRFVLSFPGASDFQPEREEAAPASAATS